MCSYERAEVAIGCLTTHFRDILVVLFSTTFSADYAAIFKSQESKEMDDSAPPGATTMAAAGGLGTG